MQEIQNLSISKYKVKIINFFICGVLYFLFTLAFDYFINIVFLTEVKPTNFLSLIFGMLTGWAGYVSCAIAELILNIISGEKLVLAVTGALITFLYGLIPALLWNYFTRKDVEHRLRINSLKKLLAFLFTILVSSIINVVLVGIEAKFVTGIKFFSIQTVFVLLNNLILCVEFGFPIFFASSVINQKVSQKKSPGKKYAFLSINEKIILFFILFSIILIACTTLNLHYIYRDEISDKFVLWNKIYINNIIILSVLFWTGFVMQIFIEKRITRPLEKMSKIAKHYGEKEDAVQNNNYVINLCKEYASYNSEIGNLARSYIYMASDSINYIRDLKKTATLNASYEKDLLFANQLQKSLLPQLYPYFTPCTNVDIFGLIKFAKDFSGDFYDYFLIDEDHLAIIICDITGHGVEAALYMAIVKNLIKDKILSELLPEEAFSELNTQLSKDNLAGLFVSCWFGVLTTSTGLLRFINAGQTQPLYLRKGQNFITLNDPVDLALAASDETLYSVNQIQLNSGDKLVLYTRGITEAQNAYDESFGVERLLQFFNRYQDIRVEELVEGLYREVSLFSGSTNQENDYTILALEYKNA